MVDGANASLATMLPVGVSFKARCFKFKYGSKIIFLRQLFVFLSPMNMKKNLSCLINKNQ